MPPRRSKKALDLPSTMVKKPVAEKMQLRSSNKGHHPGTVDDWEHPDDVKTLGEKIKKQEQKKVDSAKLQVQRDKAKVDVAILEDALRREDVARELTANRPAGTKCVPSTKNKAGNDIDPQLNVAAPPSSSNQMSQLEISTSTNEEIRERTSTAQQKISHAQDLTVLTGGDESDKESDEYIPHGDHVDAAKVGKPATKLGPKPRPVKVSAHTAIANSRSTNEGVATPKLSLPTSGPEPKAETATAPKHVLKHKSQVVTEATPEETTILCSDDGPIPPKVQIPPTKKQKVKTKTADSVKTSDPAGELAKNWEQKKSGNGPRTGKKDARNEENDSLVKAGGMVEDDEDIKPEFINIDKTKGKGFTDHKTDVIKIVKKDSPIMTAKQARNGKNKWTMNDLPGGTQNTFSKRIVPFLCEKVGQSTTPWASLSVEDVQEAVDMEFGRTEYCVAEKGAWMSLANYRITDFRHDICVEAEKAVEALIQEHCDQLSTPELIGQYMTYLITSTSPGGNVGPSPPFMWKVWKDDGAKRRGMFCHELIIQVMAEAHFMVLGPMDNILMIPYPKGALLLAGQAVERAISMWTTGVFVNTAAPAFSRQNFDDITEEFPLNPADRAKYGKDARKKSVKTKHISIYQATLDSWSEAKWNELLTEVKQAVETSTSKKRRKISTSAWLASPDIVEEEADVVFRSDPPEPDEDSDSGDCRGSVGTADESAAEDSDVNVASDVAAASTVTVTMPPSDVLSDSESDMAVD